ncbi:MAG: peptidoglycan DD-metalloendopeptidase family protein [Lachnospiraceae bacterium]|nr:peptidoglycan DD-metalloendopeptidase family protein [Lachnospiraceae bacterium]
MKKLKNAVRIAIIIAILAMIACPSVYADDIYEAKQRQQELEQELEESQSKLEELRDAVASAKAEVDQIDGQIAQVEAVITDYQTQSDQKQLEIEDLQRQIEQKQQEIDAEYESMSKRIKFLYENMDNSYLEVFFTSESFADALNKIQYQLDLTNYDRMQMEKIKGLQAEIKEKKTAVEAEKAAIDELKQAQLDQKAVLDEMLVVKAEALSNAKDAEARQAEQNAYLAGLVAEQKEIVEQLVREYEEKRKKELEEQGMNGSYVPSTGSFLWPLPYPYDSRWISSWYGYREDPFGGGYVSYHSGLDIGAPLNTPIFAVLDGQVVLSADGWNGGCGNYTVIYHGGGLYTEYMHQNIRNVSVGQYVVQGEVIGYVGTTGSSTGYHLHLGVVISDHGFDYTQRVDPAPYLGLY